MALDRTSLAVKSSFHPRSAVANRVQRAPTEAPRSTARALQERLGNRATQTLVAQSIARQADAFAARGMGAKQEKSCSPGSCECAECKHSPGKGSSLAEVFTDGASSASPVFERGESAVAGVDRPTMPAGAETITGAPKVAQTPSNVLPFPTTTPRQPEPRSQPLPETMEKSVASQANQLSSETAFSTAGDATRVRGAATSARGQEDAEEAPRTAVPAQSTAAARGQVVQADTVRSQAMIVSIATAMRQRISGLFSGVRARVSVFFTQSALTVQQFIATQQMQIAAVVAQTIQSVHAAVDRAASAADAIAANVRMMVDRMVQSAVGTLQAQVQGIANQIIGVISRFPQSSLPGVSQLRSYAASVLRRAASAVTAGLSRVGALISSALGLGMRVIDTIIGAARRLANVVVAQVGSLVQRILAVTFQILSRTAGLIGSALQNILNVSILPILNRVEGMIHRAITKAEKDAITALRNNRDEYMASLGEGGDSEDEAGGSDELTKETLAHNREIVQTFRERTSSVIGTIVQLITGAASQIIAHFRQMVAQVRQFISGLIRGAIETLRRIVQIVSSVIQSLVRAVTSAVTRVVGYVRGLIQSPIDQLVRWGREVFNKMIDFIIRIGRSIVSAVTGSPPQPSGTGDFSPVPGVQPAPPLFDPGPIPIPVPAPPVPAPVPVPVPVPVPTPAPIPIVLIIVVVIVILLILLILLYLLWRWLRKRRRRKRPAEILHKTKQRRPGSRKRTTIGVGEEVFLEYTHGPTTWATTGGQLSVAPGIPAETCRLDAPDKAGTITVTAGTASVAFNVVAPSGIAMKRTGGMKHDKNVPNSGIRLIPHLLPDNVNFYRLTWHEMDVPFGTATGYYSCNPFKTGHCGRGGGNVPCADINATNKVRSGRGTELNGRDCAYSGFCPGNALTAGQVSGSIPNEYKVNGPTGGPFYGFGPSNQVHTLEPDLVTLTTSKGGASGSIKISDSTRRNGC